MEIEKKMVSLVPSKLRGSHQEIHGRQCWEKKKVTLFVRWQKSQSKTSTRRIETTAWARSSMSPTPILVKGAEQVLYSKESLDSSMEMQVCKQFCSKVGKVFRRPKKKCLKGLQWGNTECYIKAKRKGRTQEMRRQEGTLSKVKITFLSWRKDILISGIGVLIVAQNKSPRYHLPLRRKWR